MRTVSIFKNARNQAIRIPKDMEFEGVTELEIRREGDTLLLRPVRPTWLSFASEPLADSDFLVERPAVVETGRFDLSGTDDDASTEASQ
ncbi:MULTISPECIES: type II toxin-antitoxin system VapB family antitoxin [Burkholderia]|uniref:AbrB family transcriptional regulator n=1 Tax=Burkholderia anthina TaxID=179879 RepID=A0A6P2G6H6_9BURK|nr:MULTISPECIES: type II toxin-antitoxin system VapB family antitoxin [Burkholderia]AXK65471.1 AbrB/MazE/SpoVT family DNA-binding domain-containing protein [Burkholderia sp. IDO3]MBM2770196.1 AbrB/MazE/SpoVT family DNA-binding domain-containing protein [Burkholderia anthina]PCD60445.1 AbrB family transcriptional regulator [Burkholderia sp. IDO3]PFH12800.1 antitoxin VapB [Burkholderia sp. JKS000303]QTD91452.1 AbrB/MazE/SpoVT family DNA-binding domain-containing protein [Burkholderia anthina]